MDTLEGTRCSPRYQMFGGLVYTVKLWLLQKTCRQCRELGKDFKPILNQKLFRTLPKSVEK